MATEGVATKPTNGRRDGHFIEETDRHYTDLLVDYSDEHYVEEGDFIKSIRLDEVDIAQGWDMLAPCAKILPKRKRLSPNEKPQPESVVQTFWVGYKVLGAEPTRFCETLSWRACVEPGTYRYIQCNGKYRDSKLVNRHDMRIRKPVERLTLEQKKLQKEIQRELRKEYEAKVDRESREKEENRTQNGEKAIVIRVSVNGRKGEHNTATSILDNSVSPTEKEDNVTCDCYVDKTKERKFSPINLPPINVPLIGTSSMVFFSDTFGEQEGNSVKPDIPLNAISRHLSRSEDNLSYCGERRVVSEASSNDEDNYHSKQYKRPFFRPTFVKGVPITERSWTASSEDLHNASLGHEKPTLVYVERNTSNPKLNMNTCIMTEVSINESQTMENQPQGKSSHDRGERDSDLFKQKSEEDNISSTEKSKKTAVHHTTIKFNSRIDTESESKPVTSPKSTSKVGSALVGECLPNGYISQSERWPSSKLDNKTTAQETVCVGNSTGLMLTRDRMHNLEKSVSGNKKQRASSSDAVLRCDKKQTALEGKPSTVSSSAVNTGVNLGGLSGNKLNSGTKQQSSYTGKEYISSMASRYGSNTVSNKRGTCSIKFQAHSAASLDNTACTGKRLSSSGTSKLNASAKSKLPITLSHKNSKSPTTQDNTCVNLSVEAEGCVFTGKFDKNMTNGVHSGSVSRSRQRDMKKVEDPLVNNQTGILPEIMGRRMQMAVTSQKIL